jgi:hypothetical protein
MAEFGADNEAIPILLRDASLISSQLHVHLSLKTKWLAILNDCSRAQFRDSHHCCGLVGL